MEPRITLVTLGVADLERSLAFYRDGLGWTPSSASVAGEVAFFQANGLVLALWPRHLLAADARLAADDGWGGVTLARNVELRQEVDELIGAWVAAGGRLLKAPLETDWGGYSGYAADPDGHPWEIAHNPYWTLAADGSLTLPG